MDVEDHSIARTKMGVVWGCLIWAAVLIFGPFLLFGGYFYYSVKIKETTLLISHSPSKTHTIRVMEKGEPFFFGPSLIRLKSSGEDLYTSLSNDGKTLSQANAEVEWKSDHEAMIVLVGEEQAPEIIRFKAEKDGPPSFKVQYTELGYIPTATEQDPYGEYAIQIRKSVFSKGSEQRYNLDAPVRVYYGPKDKELEKYKEWKIPDLSFRDQFNLYWNEDYVMIDVIGRNDNGTTYVKDSLKVAFD